MRRKRYHLFFEIILPILEKITSSFEIICIDDGSEDSTSADIQEWIQKDQRIKIIGLSRNFGKEAALTAGVDMASGQAVIPIDIDLQDPPELIEQMYNEWKSGAQVVLARRRDRSSDKFVKKTTAKLFYYISSLISKPRIPEDVGDFRLMDRVVVEALKSLPERSRFMKGLFA